MGRAQKLPEASVRRNSEQPGISKEQGSDSRRKSNDLVMYTLEYLWPFLYANIEAIYINLKHHFW